jgi:NAD(P)-dependent dehydrogenase (short-subunit alcohol dehydrogenase family)
VNAVAPGVVATPLKKNTPEDVMREQSPMGRVATVNEIADAVLYLTEAPSVTGEVLHVDGGAHRGKW